MGSKRYRPDALAGTSGAGGRIGKSADPIPTALGASPASHHAARAIARRFGLQAATAFVIAELAGLDSSSGEIVHG